MTGDRKPPEEERQTAIFFSQGSPQGFHTQNFLGAMALTKNLPVL